MTELIIFCAQYAYLLVVAAAVAAWLYTKNGRPKLQFALTVIVAGVIAYVLAKIAGALYYDPRPFVTQHIQPLIAHAADNGFPSDHALFTMTLTAATCFYRKKIAAVMAVLTLAVGAARVLASVHSPLDILAGWGVGIVAAAAAYWLVGRFMPSEKPPAEPEAEA